MDEIDRGTAIVNRPFLESVLRRVAPLATDGRVADAELLRRFTATRDETAFAVLVARHGPLVWDVCRQLLPHQPDAEDAFQATFLALIRGAGTIRTAAALGAWLHGVAYRIALKTRRTAVRRRHREQAAATREATDSVSRLTWHQLQAAVHEEVSRLPEPLRTAFVMCELEGLGQREAAAALGWKLGTLSGRLTKARQRLLERLSRQGVAAGAVVAGVVAGRTARAAPPAALALKTAALVQSSTDLAHFVSASVLELARGATEVSMTRTKLLVAAVALALTLVAGTATTVIPLAFAQVPGPGPAPQGPSGPVGQRSAPNAAPARGPTASAFAAGQWEYRFVPRKSESLEAFQLLLIEYGNQGWEYCGTESLLATDPARKAEWGTGPTVIFKRPRHAARASGPTGHAVYGDGMTPMASNRFSSSTSNEPLTPSGNSLAGALSRTMPANQTPLGASVTATGALDPNTASATAKKNQPDVMVITLAHAEAVSLAKTLTDLFQKDCRIVADPPTNSLLIQADAETENAIKSVVQKVDVPRDGVKTRGGAKR